MVTKWKRFVAPFILALGCANVVVLATLWILIWGEELTGRRETTSPDAASPPAQLIQPASIQNITETPPVVGLVALQNLLPPPPLPREPTATSTRVVLDTPTLMSTPATRQPTAILTPIPTIKPQPEIKHVVIISIDGLRPDAMELAHTPILDTLRARGAYSPKAQTVWPSLTLPGHASMLSGMNPEKHGLYWNQPAPDWPGLNGLTLFDVAHAAGLTTAMVLGKEKMHYLVLPNSVDKLFGADVGDIEVKNQAVEFIQAGLPHILFIHFPDVDKVGHEFGWMSPHQLQTVTFVDGLIGEVVTTLENGGYLNNTLLMITADHGGQGTGHGGGSTSERTIPWLAVGPGVRPGIALTSPINVYDTAATAAYVLKLPIPDGWDGDSVLEIFQ